MGRVAGMTLAAIIDFETTGLSPWEYNSLPIVRSSPCPPQH